MCLTNPSVKCFSIREQCLIAVSCGYALCHCFLMFLLFLFITALSNSASTLQLVSRQSLLFSHSYSSGWTNPFSLCESWSTYRVPIHYTALLLEEKKKFSFFFGHTFVTTTAVAFVCHEQTFHQQQLFSTFSSFFLLHFPHFCLGQNSTEAPAVLSRSLFFSYITVPHKHTSPGANGLKKNILYKHIYIYRADGGKHNQNMFQV